MANTYKQAYFHLIFAVANRKALITDDFKNDLEKYITGIIQYYQHKLLAIYAMPNHIHIFIGYDLRQTIPDLVVEIKTSSNSWINTNNLTNYKFSWQKGYGAFTHSHSSVESVCKYIRNQKAHHQNRTFKEEYLEILSDFSIEFKDEYLFDFLE